MKIINYSISAILIIAITLTFLSNSNQDNTKPKSRVYQEGDVKITVWTNKGKDSTSTWKNYKVEKLYMKEGEWKSSNYFNEKELVQLKELIDKVVKSEKLDD